MQSKNHRCGCTQNPKAVPRKGLVLYSMWLSSHEKLMPRNAPMIPALAQFVRSTAVSNLSGIQDLRVFCFDAQHALIERKWNRTMHKSIYWRRNVEI